MYIYIYLVGRVRNSNLTCTYQRRGAEEFINLRRSYPISALSVSPSPNIRSFNYQHSWYRSQFPSLPKCIDVASSRALSNPYSRYIGVLGIGVLIIRVFNFYLFLVPGRFFKIIPPRGCDILFFLYVKDRNQINQQQKEEKEGERERGKERD